jgi:hypothetical protein
VEASRPGTTRHPRPSGYSLSTACCSLCPLLSTRQVANILSSFLNVASIIESSSVVKVVDDSTAPFVVTHLTAGGLLLRYTRALFAACATFLTCCGSSALLVDGVGDFPPLLKPSSSLSTAAIEQNDELRRAVTKLKEKCK